MERLSVAVIGLGAAGLVALKNLKEEGYTVTGFERNGYIGGLWRYSDVDHTSVLETTIVNISKERGCFTDFPFPESVEAYPTAAQVHHYLLDYAHHFNLEPHFRLNALIQQVTFDDEQQKWAINIKDGSPHYFDKVVIAIGGVIGLPNLPNVPGLTQFSGTSIHAQSFKRPQEYSGKRVVVVGFGNSAADTATQLSGIADKVYLAHRHGAHLLPRMVNGRPIDHTLTLRLSNIQNLILQLFPLWGERTFTKFLKALQDKSYNLRPEWRFEPPQRIPIVSDTLVPCLESGTITSVHGIKRIIDSTTIELDDASVIKNIDAIIWCTGYKTSFSIIDSRFDPSIPTTSTPPSWTNAQGSNNKQLFRLYLNVFSEAKPESLAFLGNVHFAHGGFHIFDWASMAIAQAWKSQSQSRLPSAAEISKEIDQRLTWLTSLATRGFNVSPSNVDAGKWTKAMDELGGTGVNEYLGYGWKGWWFWITEMRFCNLVMGGVWTPHIYRVFEGRRKRWEGAREAVWVVNRAEEKYKMGDSGKVKKM